MTQSKEVEQNTNHSCSKPKNQQPLLHDAAVAGVPPSFYLQKENEMLSNSEKKKTKKRTSKQNKNIRNSKSETLFLYPEGNSKNSADDLRTTPPSLCSGDITAPEWSAKHSVSHCPCQTDAFIGRAPSPRRRPWWWLNLFSLLFPLFPFFPTPLCDLRQ